MFITHIKIKCNFNVTSLKLTKYDHIKIPCVLHVEGTQWLKSIIKEMTDSVMKQKDAKAGKSVHALLNVYIELNIVFCVS